MTIRAKILAISEVVDMNHKELSETVGVTSRTVYNWLNGQPLQPGHQAQIDAAADVASWSGCGELTQVVLGRGHLSPAELLQHLMACHRCREKWNQAWSEIWVRLVADGELDMRVFSDVKGAPAERKEE
jgi:hypothetical protein